MEGEQKKNVVGNIYGSRISNTGRWLNLIVATKIDGKEVRITCPVKIVEVSEKPHAIMGLTGKTATIYAIPVYDDVKPKEEPVKIEYGEMPF